MFFIVVYSPYCDPSSLIETGIVWSTNFAVLKDIFAEVPDMDPSLYCATRFSIAGLVMLPSAFGHFGNFDLVLRSSYIGLTISSWECHTEHRKTQRHNTTLANTLQWKHHGNFTDDV